MPSASGTTETKLTKWDEWQPNMLANLVFIVRESRVLLIHKKTGLGKGKINGPGGKLEEGETAIEAAVREVQEELLITPTGLEEMGILRFAFVDGLHLQVTVFRAGGYENGEPTETREAKPEWFEFEKIPYERMWADDVHWLPQMLAGRKFDARFDFDEEEMLSRQVDFL
ncbi:MAG: 8-oxo-dGTP diphosphatase [Verrucomicrobiales bacterium]|nr:8-oxo-dGTP diphosphatase [Verrucomicrobiales bacterium]